MSFEHTPSNFDVDSHPPYVPPQRRRLQILYWATAVIGGATLALGFYPYRGTVDTRSYCAALNSGEEVIADLDEDGVEERYCVPAHTAGAQRITLQEAANWQYGNWPPVRVIQEDKTNPFSGRAYGVLDSLIKEYFNKGWKSN